MRGCLMVCYSLDMSGFELLNEVDEETKLSSISFQTVVEVFLRSKYGPMSLLSAVSACRCTAVEYTYPMF